MTYQKNTDTSPSPIKIMYTSGIPFMMTTSRAIYFDKREIIKGEKKTNL